MEEIRSSAGPVIQRHFEKVEAERRAVQERVEAEQAAKRAAEEEARKKAAEAEAAAKASGASEGGAAADKDVAMADAGESGKPEIEETD